MPLQLRGTKILDLSRVLAGPLCTMTLADLGADVIKVEKPTTGDETRRWGPPFDERGESAYYLSVNRNKKSVAADFDSTEDRQLIIDLIADADVVVDNFRRGALEKRGIDPRQILEAHARLIWCTISGFGADSDRSGYDLVVQAESGWMAITGEPDGDPLRVGIALADVIAGKDATIAILAALAGRDQLKSADDRHLHISLLHSATAALINVAQNTLVTGGDAKRWGNQHPNLVPYQLFHAADRPVIIAVGTDAQWQACVNVLGLDDLARDNSLSTNAGRLANRHRVIARISERVAKSRAAELIELLHENGVPCGMVKSVLEALREVNASALTGIPPAAGGSVRIPPPRLDEHGVEIRRLGWRAFDDANA